MRRTALDPTSDIPPLAQQRKHSGGAGLAELAYKIRCLEELVDYLGFFEPWYDESQPFTLDVKRKWRA
jgi:hypothetical protein